MKKLLLTLITLILIAPLANAAYEKTERVTVLSFDERENNLIIQRRGDDEKWLLHYDGNCDEVSNESTVTINIRNTLDTSGDSLIVNSYRQCDIDQAEEITGQLTINSVYTSKTSAIVTTEDNNQFRIYYGSQCSDVWGLSSIYYLQSSSLLRKSDIIYLPDNEGQCYLSNVDEIEEDDSQASSESGEDTMSPDMVRDVLAVPGDESVFLSWDAATDNVGIAYYIVSYSTHNLNLDNYEVSEMPNQIIVNGLNYEVTGLENNDTYYFYVLSVDTSGNMSSDWSEEVSTAPSGSVRRTEAAEPTEINLTKTEETSSSFLFDWDKVDSYQRQTVIFEVNGEREFIYYNWYKNYMRVLKKDSRQGEDLTLIIRQYDIYGQMHEDEIEFEF
ncbi:fibronectin type III domain-containing protein [Patescibacteria group bacterium]|nr:fibronectin type III domain-containing protein [Patescibacteria group bacterium]